MKAVVGIFAKSLVVIALLGGFGASKAEAKSLTARITFYYPNEAKSGFRAANGDKLVPWKSAAVCFKTIHAGSKIKIPGIGTVLAHDTGRAVISRKAAKANGKNVPVIDVCVRNRAEMIKMQNTFPAFIKVDVLG